MKMPLGTEVDLRAGHIVVDGFPALRERRTASPSLDLCLLWPRSPISATAELLFSLAYTQHVLIGGRCLRDPTFRRFSNTPT